MTHIKLFDSFNFKSNLDKLEDILLIYLDEGKCRISGNSHFKTYEFVGDLDDDKSDFSKAVMKLKENSLDNFYVNGYQNAPPL